MESLSGKRKEIQSFQHLNVKISFFSFEARKACCDQSSCPSLEPSVFGSLCVPWACDCVLTLCLRCGVLSSATTCTSGIQSVSGPLP